MFGGFKVLACVCVCVLILIYLLTAICLTPGASSIFITHLHKNNTQHNTMKDNTQNRTYITIRIHKL